MFTGHDDLFSNDLLRFATDTKAEHAMQVPVSHVGGSFDQTPPPSFASWQTILLSPDMKVRAAHWNAQVEPCLFALEQAWVRWGDDGTDGQSESDQSRLSACCGL